MEARAFYTLSTRFLGKAERTEREVVRSKGNRKEAVEDNEYKTD